MGIKDDVNNDGDVEVLGYISSAYVGDGFVRVTLIGAGTLPKLNTQVVDLANVSHLTAELNESRRQIQLLNEAGEFLDGVSQGVEDKLRAENASLQSELTKAREEIQRFQQATSAMADEINHLTIRAIAAEEMLDAGPSYADGTHPNQYEAELEVEVQEAREQLDLIGNLIPEEYEPYGSELDCLTAYLRDLKTQVASGIKASSSLRADLKSVCYARDKYVTEVGNLNEKLEDACAHIACLSKAGAELLDYAESGWDHFPDVAVNMRAALANQPAPAPKNLTKQSPNQCDGCQAGIPIEVNQYGTPLHRMGCEGKYPDYMACTAKLYLKIPQNPLDSP